MPCRATTTACILAFVCGVLLFSCLYGPLRRTFVSPARVVPVDSAATLYKLYASNGVRGRIAILFTRHLIAAEYPYASPEIKYIEDAMHHGIVRELYHVVPDRLWAGVAWNLSQVTIYWPTPYGFVGAFEDGRVNVLPLSRLMPMKEKALVLLDAETWTREELHRIAAFIETGNISTDLLAILGGSPDDLAKFDLTVSAAAR